MRSYAFVLASMYRYSWLITFDIFQNFFFWIEGWGVSYPKFFGFLYFFYIYKAPKTMSGPAQVDGQESDTASVLWVVIVT